MSPNNPIFIDPTTFQEGQLTFILCNDAQGMLGWFIKWYTKGNYCHAMLSRKPGFVVTQNDWLVEKTIDAYLIRSEELKFWRINNLTQDEFNLINNAINADLAKPWWNRMYNYLGLVGQALHVPGISMPGQNICSQRDAEYLRMLPRLDAVVPEHPSPADLYLIFTNNPNLFTCIGYWLRD
jgi:hypothetical protein